jgi:hypothetical protein
MWNVPKVDYTGSIAGFYDDGYEISGSHITMNFKINWICLLVLSFTFSGKTVYQNTSKSDVKWSVQQ